MATEEEDKVFSVLEEEIHPLKTLEELLKWRKPKNEIEEVVNVRKLCSRACPSSSSHPLTLICHDMKGGYLDDRFYRGSKNKDAYRFYNWSGVDTFIYFSHHLVTIPPPGWIHAAHLHGVKVLGTFITEWDQGAEICEKILSDKNSVQNIVLQLVRIAQYHGFEGWLLNIENKISHEQIGLLTDFIGQLTTAMKEVCPNSVVLWYDSVTKEGELKWQNELNEMNRQFFDACDGIFLNYTWNEDGLTRSMELAGDRKMDVWVGLDVFGRNFYEGGKFNTHKALEIVRAKKMSAAIFAQGWTYETQDNFEEAENQMWKSFSPHLCHHGPQRSPFKTSFCQGFGEKLFVEGQVTCDQPWHDLCKQQYQPIWSQEVDNGKLNLIISDAFNGGGCIGLTSFKQTFFRLFSCGITWKVALLVTISYKWQTEPVPLAINLCVKSGSDHVEEKYIVLQCEGAMDSSKSSMANGPSLVVDTSVNGWFQKTFSVPEADGQELVELAIFMDGKASLMIGEMELQNQCVKGLQQ